MNIPKDAPLVYISFSAEINQITTEALISSLASCANANVKTVHILLSTTGGTVVNGFNLYNLIIGMPFETIMHNVGQVNSIGTLIFLGAEKRYATPNSTFMFHGIGSNIQNQRLEEKDFRDGLENVLNQQDRLAVEYVKRTSLSDSEIADFFRTGQTINSEIALSKGVIHEIREVNLSPGHPIVSHIFQRK